MNRYSLEVCIRVNADAPSLEDARQALEDVFGTGEMEGFDMDVISFDIKEF
jgi:hypothetical protein